MTARPDTEALRRRQLEAAAEALTRAAYIVRSAALGGHVPPEVVQGIRDALGLVVFHADRRAR